MIHPAVRQTVNATSRYNHNENGENFTEILSLEPDKSVTLTSQIVSRERQRALKTHNVSFLWQLDANLTYEAQQSMSKEFCFKEMALIADKRLLQKPDITLKVRGFYIRTYSWNMIWLFYHLHIGASRFAPFVEAKVLLKKAAHTFVALRAAGLCKLVADQICSFVLLQSNLASATLLANFRTPVEFKEIAHEHRIVLRNSVPIVCDELQRGIYKRVYELVRLNASAACCVQMTVQPLSSHIDKDQTAICFPTNIVFVCNDMPYDKLYVALPNLECKVDTAVLVSKKSKKRLRYALDDCYLFENGAWASFCVMADESGGKASLRDRQQRALNCDIADKKRWTDNADFFVELFREEKHVTFVPLCGVYYNLKNVLVGVQGCSNLLIN